VNHLVRNLGPECRLGDLKPGVTFAVERDALWDGATGHYVVTDKQAVFIHDDVAVIGRVVMRCDSGRLLEWHPDAQVRPTSTCLVDVCPG
jgi:hypothetical protein